MTGGTGEDAKGETEAPPGDQWGRCGVSPAGR